VDTCRNLLLVEEEYVFSYSQNVKTIFKLLIPVVIDHLMEICGNSQAEI